MFEGTVTKWPLQINTLNTLTKHREQDVTNIKNNIKLTKLWNVISKRVLVLELPEGALHVPIMEGLERHVHGPRARVKRFR